VPDAYCPDCDEKIVIQPEPRLGQRLNCPYCDADLEVINVDPLELDWVYDWSDEEWESEEEDL